MLHARLWKAGNVIHINHLPLPFLNIYRLSRSTGPLVFYLGFLEIWILNNDLYNTLLHTTPLIDFPLVTIHLYGTSVNWIPKAMSFFHDHLFSSSTLGTHNLPWYLNTISHPFSKSITFCLWKFSFIQAKQGRSLASSLLQTLVMIHPYSSPQLHLNCNPTTWLQIMQVRAHFWPILSLSLLNMGITSLRQPTHGINNYISLTYVIEDTHVEILE